MVVVITTTTFPLDYSTIIIPIACLSSISIFSFFSSSSSSTIHSLPTAAAAVAALSPLHCVMQCNAPTSFAPDRTHTADSDLSDDVEVLQQNSAAVRKEIPLHIRTYIRLKRKVRSRTALSRRKKYDVWRPFLSLSTKTLSMFYRQ